VQSLAVETDWTCQTHKGWEEYRDIERIILLLT